MKPPVKVSAVRKEYKGIKQWMSSTKNGRAFIASQFDRDLHGRFEQLSGMRYSAPAAQRKVKEDLAKVAAGTYRNTADALAHRMALYDECLAYAYKHGFRSAERSPRK